MRVKISSFIALICVLIYVAAIGLGAFRVYVSINGRHNIAEREFRDLADIASSAGVMGFMEQPFKDAIRDVVTGSETLQGVIVSGPYGTEYTVERNDGDVIDWIGDSPRFKPRFGISRAPHFSALHIEGLRNVTITAVSSYVDFPTCLEILKESLFIILAGLILSFIALLIHSLQAKASAPLVSEKLQKTVSAVKPAGAAPPADAPLEEISIPETPKGLYSSGSNISWESHTVDRLNSELRRCTDAKQDLALLVMELSINANDDVYRTLADRVVQFFGYRDLIFEKGERGITVIIPNLSLEQGLAKAEQFHSQILSNLRNNDIRIGLSSRAGRIINADRLLFEAFKALERAQQEPVSPIVAFKTDPEKYRAFLQNREKNP